MIMTGCVPTNTVVPYWNEIKKWSREDRSNLAKLIETSLDDEAESSEPVNAIPVEFLEMASEYALKESRAGRCIPHEKAMNWIKEKRGWK